MFGRHYYPNPDEHDWVRIYDRSYSAWVANQTTEGRNFATQPSTTAERDAIFTQIDRQHDYTRWRQRNNRQLEEQQSFWKGTEELKLSSLTEKTTDRPRLQPFKIKYDTLEEVRMRFNKTVLLIKGHPFSVTDQRTVQGRFFLLLEDPEGVKQYVAVEDVPDFRPAPSVYVQCQHETGYLMRSPARVNQQGMTSQSVNIKKVGTKDYIPVRNEMIRDSLRCYGKVLKWDAKYQMLLSEQVLLSIRLSDRVAIYQKKGHVLAEYKGRRLGKVDGHGVRLDDEDDVIQPWLKRDLTKVELEVMQ